MLKLQVSFAEYGLFYRALLHKRHISLSRQNLKEDNCLSIRVSLVVISLLPPRVRAGTFARADSFSPSLSLSFVSLSLSLFLSLYFSLSCVRALSLYHPFSLPPHSVSFSFTHTLSLSLPLSFALFLFVSPCPSLLL